MCDIDALNVEHQWNYKLRCALALSLATRGGTSEDDRDMPSEAQYGPRPDVLYAHLSKVLDEANDRAETLR